MKGLRLFFRFTSTVLTHELVIENIVIGYWGIDEGKIYCEFTEEGAEKYSLTGNFNVQGVLQNLDENDTSITIEIGDVEVEVDVKPTDPGSGGGDYPGEGEPGKVEPIYKFGYYFGEGSTKISWYVLVNRDIYYEQAIGTDQTKQRNVIIEDVIAEGLTVTDVTLQTILDRPSAEFGKPTATTIGPLTIFNSQGANCIGSLLTKVEQNSGETYADFRQRVIGTGGVAYGIHADDNNKYSVIVSLGDLPGNGVTYSDVLQSTCGQGNFKANLKQFYPSFTDAELDAMDYAFGPDNAIGGQITTYRLYINTEGELDQEYENTAYLTFNDTEEIVSNTDKIQTKSLHGSVTAGEPGSARLYKEDKDISGKRLEGARFKLQTWLNNEWKDYEPLDGGQEVRETNSDGMVEFKKLVPGTYRFVEVVAAPGYDIESVSYSQDQFVIADSETEGIVVMAFNSQSTGFIVTKRSTRGDAVLSNAGFILYRMAGDQEEYYCYNETDQTFTFEERSLATTLYTKSDGTISVTGLPWGTYYLKETVAPSGHLLPTGDDAITKIVLDGESGIVSVTVHNRPTGTNPPPSTENPDPEDPDPKDPDPKDPDPQEPGTPDEDNDISDSRDPDDSWDLDEPPIIPDEAEESDSLPEELQNVPSEAKPGWRKNPATGDTGNLLGVFGLLTVSLGGMIVSFHSKENERN